MGGPITRLPTSQSIAQMTCRWHNHYATRTTTKQTIHGLAKVGNLGVSEIDVTPDRDSSHDLHAPQKAASFRTATAPPYQFALCNYAFILCYPPLVMYHRDATQIVTLDWSARQGRGMRSWCQCYHSTGATEPQSHRAAGSRQQQPTQSVLEVHWWSSMGSRSVVCTLFDGFDHAKTGLLATHYRLIQKAG